MAYRYAMTTKTINSSAWKSWKIVQPATHQQPLIRQDEVGNHWMWQHSSRVKVEVKLVSTAAQHPERCDCGKVADWYGDQHGLRVFACRACATNELRH